MQDNPNYSYISTIITPDETTHYIKDAEARSAITELESYVDGQISGLGTVLNYKGTKTSETDIKDLTSAKAGDVWINTSDNSEWVCKETISVATASAWERLGPTIDLSGYAQTENLGGLAFKNTASGNYTPAGTVSVPTITVTPNTDTVNSITDVGSLPSLSTTVSNETLTISFNAGSLPTKGDDTTVVTGIQSASSSTPTFSGTSANITVS